MNFLEYCKPYINKYNTFNQSSGEDNQNSGNALLYYSTYVRILNEYGYSIPRDLFNETIREYYVSSNAGLLNRYPMNQHDRQAHDDYVGVLSAASITSCDIAFELFNYGREHYWNYDNINPDIIDLNDLKGQNYFGRHWGFIAHAYFANKEKPNLFERLRWIIGVVSNAFKKNGMSGAILTWHQIKTFEDSKFNLLFCKLAARLWKNRLRKQFPNLMGDVFEQYYLTSHPNKDHPFSIFMKGKI